ncbi:hypothetical protein [Halosimplex halophilum]|uniref:hypothetical protein n=1 Tax=Halosimplex halophilum TaxID=2559572 RepID=UPI0014355E8D|nr:hypothetical protein [Halosimplex halophilum]
MATLQEYWEQVGVGGLILVGVLLFFVPEPTTSFLGIVVLMIASVIWLANWER